MFRRSLICTDFVDGLHRLVKFVPSLAASGMQQIVFLHTLPISQELEVPRVDEKDIQAVRDRLSAALQEVPDGVDVRIEVQTGKPVDNILRVSQAYNSDLIIVGMPDRGVLNEKLFGSTTIGLCQRTQIPILTLRPQLISTYTSQELDLRCRHLFRYLLLPYDGSDAANRVIGHLKGLASQDGPRSLEACLLCWVVEAQKPRSLPQKYDKESALQKLTEVKAGLDPLNLAVEVDVREGNPLPELLAAALERDVTAIAISSGHTNRLMDWSVPSFAEEILRRSWYPVIYFPPERR